MSFLDQNPGLGYPVAAGFGLLVGTGQMLSGAAFGVAAAGLASLSGKPDSPERQRFHDLGNLLLM